MEKFHLMNSNCNGSKMKFYFIEKYKIYYIPLFLNENRVCWLCSSVCVYVHRNVLASTVQWSITVTERQGLKHTT